MIHIILLALLHMQWRSSNLKTQGQPNVLEGAEEEPSQWKYKEEKNPKKKIWKKEKFFALEEYSDEKEEKAKEKSPKTERNRKRSRSENKIRKCTLLAGTS